MISHDPRIAARQIAQLIQGIPIWILDAPIEKLAEAIQARLEKPKCPNCAEEIDPRVCWCGAPAENHSSADNHGFIPSGCNCARMSGNPLNQPKSPLDD